MFKFRERKNKYKNSLVQQINDFHIDLYVEWSEQLHNSNTKILSTQFSLWDEHFLAFYLLWKKFFDSNISEIQNYVSSLLIYIFVSVKDMSLQNQNFLQDLTKLKSRKYVQPYSTIQAFFFPFQCVTPVCRF
mgnify:CR=1 FL=1